MKTTTTLYDYVQSELIKDGHNEFFHEPQISFNDEKYIFMRKYIKMDEDVYKIMNRTFFTQFYLKNDEDDKRFKRLFLTKFMDAQFMLQTVDATIARCISICIEYEDYLNLIFSELNEFITGKTNEDNTSKTNSVTDSRNAFNDLPSDLVNIDVDKFILEYATNNTINRSKTTSDTKGNRKSDKKDIDNLIKSRELLVEIMNEFDKKLFLKIW